MCGIAGLIGSGRDNVREDRHGVAERMASQLRHRGPDGGACYMDPSALLVHTRLSIIDLSTGAQPLHNEDKTLWLICNGEIFNYVELRAQLKARGHQFSTNSDCEVILHLYEEHGLEFIDHLNGQFALCLWDAKSQTAVLARDRVGIAPLFYREGSEGLWFASEVKAMLAGRQESPRMDVDAFNQLLSFWAPVSPSTIFAGVQEVSPGEMLVYREGRLESRRYWDLDFPAHGDHADISVDRAASEIRDLLEDATRIRLRADVPVAAYLSGGLDSSAITALIREQSTAPLKTYSLTFADSGLDESSYQSEVVRQLQTDHRSVDCSDEKIVERFEQAVWHAESPLIRSAPVPMSLLSELVHRDGTRVVLTGEGADEVFGGYDIFKEAKLRRFWASNPQSAWRPLLIKRLYPYLNLSQGNAGDYLARFFGGGVEQAAHPLFSHQPRMNSTAMIRQFMSDDFRRGSKVGPEQSLLDSLPAAFGSWSWFGQAQYLEMKTLMSGYLLSAQGDRMLMENSVEGRFPFLDHRLIEYVNRLDPRLKMRVLNEKFILKRSLGNLVPPSILKRYKQPYRAPMGQAFVGGREPDYLRYLLSEEQLSQYGYFDSRKVALLLKKLRAGRALGYKDNMALIVILSTQSWHQQFVEEFPSRFAVRQPSRQAGLQLVA
ncbi:asparagine synthase (glutamine-hydrolyzing) [Proteobacteria bacterium 005FR1]|nr:asparagine synthase (glutamine-hydrolyzing) [Proteobacteria bacterium 005FR1]